MSVSTRLSRCVANARGLGYRRVSLTFSISFGAACGPQNLPSTTQTVKETVNPAIEQAAATVKPVLAAAGEKIKESAPSTVGGKAVRGVCSPRRCTELTRLEQPPVTEQLSQVMGIAADTICETATHAALSSTQATENIKSSLGTSAPADPTTHEPKTALDSLAAPGYVDAAKEAVRQVGDKVSSVLPASFMTAPARETPIEAAEHGTTPHGHEKEHATPTTIADNKSETGKNAEQTREVADTRVAKPVDDKVGQKSVGSCTRGN